jgi:hypothetical protein
LRSSVAEPAAGALGSCSSPEVEERLDSGPEAEVVDPIREGQAGDTAAAAGDVDEPSCRNADLAEAAGARS